MEAENEAWVARLKMTGGPRWDPAADSGDGPLCRPSGGTSEQLKNSSFPYYRFLAPLSCSVLPTAVSKGDRSEARGDVSLLNVRTKRFLCLNAARAEVGNRHVAPAGGHQSSDVSTIITEDYVFCPAGFEIEKKKRWK